MSILVAGVGNIFNRDDGFGPAVIRELEGRGVLAVVKDFGIRGRDLAFELLDDWSFVVILDAIKRDGGAGAVHVVEMDTEAAGNGVVDGHSIDLNALVGYARQLGAQLPPIVIVGCEPESVEEGIGLSPPVENAVQRAVEIVDKLVRERL